MIDFLLSENK